MSGVDENQTIWKNTVSAFKRQFTQLDKLFVDAKSCAIDLADPSHNMNGKEAKKLVEPLQRKLELVNNYINSLHKVLHWLLSQMKRDNIVWRDYQLPSMNVWREQKGETWNLQPS